jgi:hypothetical protein
MNKQAYINGFVKRANEYGYTTEQAEVLLKEAAASWRTGNAGIRKKLYELLNPSELEMLVGKNLTHPHGVDAGRLAVVAKKLNSPDVSQAARIKDVLKQKLKDHAAGTETEHMRSYMNKELSSPNFLEQITGTSRKVFSPVDIKQKILEAGGLYNKPNLP